MSTSNFISPRTPEDHLYTFTPQMLPPSQPSFQSLTDIPFDKPGQPSRPRALNPSRIGSSPVNRPVRSAPASPSGRIIPSGLGPLSPISPILLAEPLPGKPRSGYGWDRANGHGEGSVGTEGQPRWMGSTEQVPTLMSAPGDELSKRPSPSAPRPKLLPRSSSYGNSLNHIPQPLRSRPIKSPQSHISAVPPSLSATRTPPRPLVVKSRSRSRPLAPSLHSSGSDTETGIESDSTVRPGRIKGQSLSQPDLAALRNRLEGWAGDVAARQMEGKRDKSAGSTSALGLGERWTQAKENGKAHEGHARRSSTGRKTPPERRHSAQTGRPSPRTSTSNLSPLTPVSSLSSLSSSSPMRPAGGMTGSEDADDDFDGTDSPSSGSLSFSPKRRELRRRVPLKEKSADLGRLTSGLGLVFTDEPAAHVSSDPDVEAEVKEESLFSLRLLAVFPAVWGYLVLMQAVITGGIWVNLYPWGIDTSREALDRVIMGWGMEGTWGRIPRGDLLLAAAWAVLTGHYCFDMTTGLTHRWRVYYDLPATITRLLSIQCICWPLTGLTLWVLGPERILFAWVVIGCTTAASRSVQMYVTSNIAAGPGLGGDVTPRRKSSVPLPARGRSPRTRSEDGTGDREAAGSAGTDHSVTGGWLEQFKMDRRWDWDMMAREVGWKLGVLLLLTNAWLFWGIEVGRFG